MAIAMSGVFDERFLINFCLPPGILNVGDMMLVDSLLEKKTKLTVDKVTFSGQKDEVEEIHLGDNSNNVEECSESPEATRHFKKDEDDLINFNQRRMSVFHNPDKEINFHNGADMTFGLSPILRENLNNTIDGNYDRMCTTFNTFGSPNWLDNNDGEIKDKPNIDDEEILPNFNDYDPAYESEFIQEELPEFCSSMLETLSINSENSVDGYTPDKKKLSKKSREKRHKLKQTTVTFYYDSDEEIQDTCDDSDAKSNSEEIKRGLGHQKRNKGVRNALGMRIKNKESTSSKNSNIHSSNDINSVSNHSETVNKNEKLPSELDKWMRKKERINSIFVCCNDTREALLKTIVETSIDSYDSPKSRHKAVSKVGSYSLIQSQAVLIVTVKSQVEIWATHIRNLPEPRLLLYTDTLVKRRKLGAYNLSQYDVIITTFDILRAKEVCIPEEYSSESDPEERSYPTGLGGDSNGSNIVEKSFSLNDKENLPLHKNNIITDNDNDTFNSQVQDRKCKNKLNIRGSSTSWLNKRKNNVLLELSNAHLIDWRTVVYDNYDSTNVSSGTAKGNAAKLLKAKSKIAVILSNYQEKEGSRGKKGVVGMGLKVKKGRCKININDYDSDNSDNCDGNNNDNMSDTDRIIGNNTDHTEKYTNESGSDDNHYLKNKKNSGIQAICKNMRDILRVPVSTKDKEVTYDIRKKMRTYYPDRF
mmetsp:Transcript_7608/g.7692  ORF Transcript_7608/g.7692 Transcript_7608/m.7692 type:complete len:702 (+) Transcript_7608:84-2189(+)